MNPEPKPSRALTVIQHAAQKRREALLKRIEPLQREIAQLDAILNVRRQDETGELYLEKP